MSKSGQAFVAATYGHSCTMYAMMRHLGIPLSPEQEKFQAYLESKYPAVIEEGETNEGERPDRETPGSL